MKSYARKKRIIRFYTRLGHIYKSEKEKISKRTSEEGFKIILTDVSQVSGCDERQYNGTLA